MIFKQETQILKCTFEKEHFSKVKAAFKDRWPVVYLSRMMKRDKPI